MSGHNSLMKKVMMMKMDQEAVMMVGYINLTFYKDDPNSSR